MINKSIFFGIQNFIYVASDTTDGTYDYTAYMDAKGGILISKTTKTDLVDSARYYLATGTYSTIWAARATYTYLLPNELEAIEF